MADLAKSFLRMSPTTRSSSVHDPVTSRSLMAFLSWSLRPVVVLSTFMYSYILAWDSVAASCHRRSGWVTRTKSAKSMT